MKALELVVHPRLKRPRYGHQIDAYRQQWKREKKLIESKRLTDAELAAEYQNSRLISYVRHRRTQTSPGNTTLFDHYERGLEQEWTLERFATLPHYDEDHQ